MSAPGGDSGPAGGGPPRERWASRSGFVLASVGSAVGLGNMWRFPYLTAESGGAAFLVLYVLMLVLLGLPILLAEFTLGRGARRSPIEALAHYGGRGWRPVGVVFVGTGFLILSYYGVIAGWTVRYTGLALAGFGTDPGALFRTVSGGWDAVAFQLAFMAATTAVVAAGVRRGIERAAVVLMPLLFVAVAGIAAHAATLPGAGEGYGFYLHTDFRRLLSLEVLARAAGQAFFSLSLGVGGMLTFASYLSRDDDLGREALLVSGSDFLVAFGAGLMVFPLIFALGLSEAVGESSVGTLFIGLPRAFAGMGEAGRPVGTVFFATLLVGALTSALSMLELVTASCMDSLGWSRRRAAAVGGVLIAAAGVPAAFSLEVLAAVDQVVTNVLVLGGGLALAVFVGWVMPDPAAEAARGAGRARWVGPWLGFLRYVAPVLLGLVFLTLLGPTWEAVRAVLGG